MEKLRNRGPKSDTKMATQQQQQQCAPYLEDAVSTFEKRRGGLVNRQQYLTDKITTMERCIPALMAFNMWTSGQSCDDPALCKVRKIMNQLSPNSDPTEKLVEKLKNAVTSLNAETAELHDKIIEADIALEESGMELDSIVLANEEFEGKLKSLEKELKMNESPSLHSINSEDLFCLSKIRQLGEEQLSLKHGIRELEEREAMFHAQINRLLTSKEFRKATCAGGTNKNACGLERNDRKMQCAVHDQRSNVRQQKKRPMVKEKKSAGAENTINPATNSRDKSAEKPDTESAVTSDRNNPENGKEIFSEPDYSRVCTCPTSASIACYDKSSCSRTSGAPSKSQSSRSALTFCKACTGKQQRSQLQPGCTAKSCGLALVSRSNLSSGQVCAACCKTLAITAKSSRRQTTSQSCELGSLLCRKCLGFAPCEQCSGSTTANSCRCSCKGKCALGESDVECNCAEYLNSVEDKGYQPSGHSDETNDPSSTDEEYCECCDCGCEDSDNFSDSCKC